MRRSIKKAMSLTLASAMTLSLAACGGSNTAKETTAAVSYTHLFIIWLHSFATLSRNLTARISLLRAVL